MENVHGPAEDFSRDFGPARRATVHVPPKSKKKDQNRGIDRLERLEIDPFADPTFDEEMSATTGTPLFAGAPGAPKSQTYFDLMGDFFDSPDINVFEEVSNASPRRPPPPSPPTREEVELRPVGLPRSHSHPKRQRAPKRSPVYRNNFQEHDSFPGNDAFSGNDKFPGNEKFRGSEKFPGNDRFRGNDPFPENDELIKNQDFHNNNKIRQRPVYRNEFPEIGAFQEKEAFPEKNDFLKNSDFSENIDVRRFPDSGPNFSTGSGFSAGPEFEALKEGLSTVGERAFRHGLPNTTPINYPYAEPPAHFNPIDTSHNEADVEVFRNGIHQITHSKSDF